MNHEVSNAQHGFLQGRSTVTQLLAFYHGIGVTLDKGLQFDIVYLDLANAFDSVSHHGRLLKSTGNFCSGSRATLVSLQVVLQFHHEFLRAVFSVPCCF